MSLILFLFYWIVIPGAIIVVGIWLWRHAATAVTKSAVLVACTAALGWFLWLAVGEMWLADQQVREFCAKDGGVKVYETVTLPKERFNQWGQMLIPDIKNYTHLNDEYYSESETQFYEENGNPKWVKSHKDRSLELMRLPFKVYRKLDNKLLGESVSYMRRGGGLPGPWAESSYKCPTNEGDTDLNKQIFKIN